MRSMELLAFVRRVIAWRWTPCVAPVMGSILIALLTLAVVPDEIGGAGTGTGPLALRAKADANADTTGDDTSAEGAPGAAAAAARHPGVGNGRPRMPADSVQGFFHKAQELPIEPVDPTPQPPPPEPPPPAPTATVFTLPDVPGALPPPEVPLQPLGAAQ